MGDNYNYLFTVCDNEAITVSFGFNNDNKVFLRILDKMINAPKNALVKKSTLLLELDQKELIEKELNKSYISKELKREVNMYLDLPYDLLFVLAFNETLTKSEDWKLVNSVYTFRHLDNMVKFNLGFDNRGLTTTPYINVDIIKEAKVCSTKYYPFKKTIGGWSVDYTNNNNYSEKIDYVEDILKLIDLIFTDIEDYLEEHQFLLNNIKCHLPDIHDRLLLIADVLNLHSKAVSNMFKSLMG